MGYKNLLHLLLNNENKRNNGKSMTLKIICINMMPFTFERIFLLQRTMSNSLREEHIIIQTFSSFKNSTTKSSMEHNISISYKNNDITIM